MHEGVIQATMYLGTASSTAGTSPLAAKIAASGAMAVNAVPDVAARWQGMPCSRAEQSRAARFLCLTDGRCDVEEEQGALHCACCAVGMTAGSSVPQSDMSSFDRV